jgi:hypothetical protein
MVIGVPTMLDALRRDQSHVRVRRVGSGVTTFTAGFGEGS